MALIAVRFAVLHRAPKRKSITLFAMCRLVAQVTAMLERLCSSTVVMTSIVTQSFKALSLPQALETCSFCHRARTNFKSSILVMRQCRLFLQVVNIFFWLLQNSYVLANHCSWFNNFVNACTLVQWSCLNFVSLFHWKANR